MAGVQQNSNPNTGISFLANSTIVQQSIQIFQGHELSTYDFMKLLYILLSNDVQ